MEIYKVSVIKYLIERNKAKKKLTDMKERIHFKMIANLKTETKE